MFNRKRENEGIQQTLTREELFTEIIPGTEYMTDGM